MQLIFDGAYKLVRDFIKKQIPEPTPGIAECGMSVGEAWTSALLETVMGQIHWVKNLDFELWS